MVAANVLQRQGGLGNCLNCSLALGSWHEGILTPGILTPSVLSALGKRSESQHAARCGNFTWEITSGTNW